MIEFELACTSQALTERFGDAAEQLSLNFPASKTSLERVQEQFLKGAWLKSESRIVESWHALGSTIREAQELGENLSFALNFLNANSFVIGIDKENSTEALSEFEIEIRRRLWTLLYIWDWSVAPDNYSIDERDTYFPQANVSMVRQASPDRPKELQIRVPKPPPRRVQLR